LALVQGTPIGGGVGVLWAREWQMASKNVFISMGRRYLDQHKDFLKALMALLDEYGVRPRVIDETDYPSENPLSDIAEVLRECSGAIIVAHERTFLQSGLEMQKRPLADIRYSTPWNQIEGAMAFALDMPILILLQDGVSQDEGLFGTKTHWDVNVLPEISDAALSDSIVRNRISRWCDRVKARKPTQSPRLRIGESSTIPEFFGTFTLWIWLLWGGLILGAFSLGYETRPHWDAFTCKYFGENCPAQKAESPGQMSAAVRGQ